MSRYQQVELSPSVWVFQHDGITFEFASLDAAISYIKGFKSGWSSDNKPKHLMEFCFVNDIVGATARNQLYGQITNRSEKRVQSTVAN